MSGNGPISNKTFVVNVRLTEGMLRLIDEDIMNNQLHRTRSDWIQTALDHYLLERNGDLDRKKRPAGGGGLKIKIPGATRAPGGTEVSMSLAA